MSIQNAKALYSRLLADEEFKQQLEQAASHQQRHQILQAAGFSCTPAELDIAKRELLQSIETETNQELSETEEEGIIGGTSLQSLLAQFDDYLLKEK
jgi:predicted ribosomally synthesized peptide with nif11-like leader